MDRKGRRITGIVVLTALILMIFCGLAGVTAFEFGGFFPALLKLCFIFLCVIVGVILMCLLIEGLEKFIEWAFFDD